MYQARSLLGSDSTGLSDPFVRVIIDNHCTTSHIVDESLSPTWDETLTIDNVLLTGSGEQIADNPPNIMIEIYDYDAMVNSYNFFTSSIYIKCQCRNSRMFKKPLPFEQR